MYRSSEVYLSKSLVSARDFSDSNTKKIKKTLVMLNFEAPRANQYGYA